MIYLLSFESPLKGLRRLQQFLSILTVSSSADIWVLACYIWIWKICSYPEPGSDLALTSPARRVFAGPLWNMKTDESTSEAFWIAQNSSKATSLANEPIGGRLCLLLCGDHIQSGCEHFEQPFLIWEVSDLCSYFLVLKEEVNTYSQFDPH